MLTTISLWLIYLASYWPDYILILVIVIIKQFLLSRKNGVPFWDAADYVVWAALLALIAFSFVVAFFVSKMEMNSRIKHIPEKDMTIGIFGYIYPLVITLATTIFTDWWIPVNIVLVIVAGIIFVKSRAVQHLMLFVFPLNNRIFVSGEDILITNYTFDEMRIAQEDSLDGIQARELAKGIYYVRKVNKR